MLRLRRSLSSLHLRLTPPAGVPTTEEGDPWNLCHKVYRTNEFPVERGGFALVFTGEVLQQDNDPVKVAIKTLMRKSDEEPVIRIYKRLRREAKIWAKLPVNPHIARFFGYVVEELNGDVQASLVSLWYPNGHIVKYLRNNPLANREALCIGVILGLKYLHENQPPGAGVPRYLAPECLGRKPSPPGDIYAFGCVGLQIIFKRVPFQGKEDHLISKRELPKKESTGTAAPAPDCTKGDAALTELAVISKTRATRKK